MTSSPTSTPPPSRGLSRLRSGALLPPPFWRRWSATRWDRVIGWGGGIALALLALALRLWHLGDPKKFQFDETYYAKDAWSLLNFGHSRNYLESTDPDTDTVNSAILSGDLYDQWREGPSLTVHPEVGKWLIAGSEHLFGMDPFGWRFASAFIGALLVLLMVRFVRRVSGSAIIGLFAGVLVAFDGMLFVLSRLALLDIFLAFFIVAGVHCVVADRQWFRDRLGTDWVTDTGWGRRVLFRPWLLAAGVMFGLAIGTKWSGAYPLAAFGLLVWAWSAAARRSRGVRFAALKSAVIDGVPAFFSLVGVAFVVYVATWTGWLINADQYEEYLSQNTYAIEAGHGQWPTATEPDRDGLGEVAQSLESLFYYHRDVYEFHTNGLLTAEHPYASDPATWIVMAKPVGVEWVDNIQPGTKGCTAATGEVCVQQVLLLGNPVIWWAGAAAMIGALVLWLGARDWRFGVAVVGVASTWLPWIFEASRNSRPIFSFYMSATLPFMILAIALIFGRFLGPTTAPSTRRSAAIVLGGTFLVLVLIAFGFFWPILTDQVIPRGEWSQRLWFTRWI